MEDRIEEDETLAVCRFNKKTGGWEPIEDHCVRCGRKECEVLCDCLDSYFSALAILKSSDAGGGEEIKYVFVVVL